MDTITRAQLLAAGLSVGQIARRVRTGRLLRVRRGHYAEPGVEPDVLRAVAVGGRVGCVSELRLRGVWVVAPSTIHVHVAPGAARLRRTEGITLHWAVLLDEAHATPSHASVVDALAMASGCLDDWSAIAAMESAVNRGELSLVELRSRTAHASARLRALVRRVEPNAESGLETIVRLLVIELGLRVVAQVRYAGIGIADLVVEDWVVIETDGSTHDDPAVSVRDRRRDARHAAAGRTALRFRYHQVMAELPSVAAAIIGAVRAHRRVPNSGEIARRAVARLERLDFS